MSLHDLDETVALPDPVTGRVKIPSSIRNSHIFMTSNGVYLLGQFDLEMLLTTDGSTHLS